MTRRSNEADAFEDAWEAIRTGRDARVPDAVRDVVEMAELIVATAADVAPRPDFSADLRARLMTEAATVLVAQERVAAPPERAAATREHTVRRRLGGLAAAAVASLGAVGLVTASASAIPGDALYPVKQGVESVQQQLRSGQVSEGQYQLERAGERLREAQLLADQGVGIDDQRMVDLLETFSTQADSGSQDLLDAWSSDESSGTLETLGTFTMRASRDLASLGDRVEGSEGSAPLDQAAGTVQDLATQVGSLCRSCVDIDALTDRLGLVSDQADQTVRTTGRTPTSAQTATTKSAGSRPAAPAATQPRPSAGSGGGATSAPTARPTEKADPVGGVLDPVVGGVLGDEDQPGLIPGLLAPLLGTR